MSTIFLDISAALDSRLNTMSNLPPVQWENRTYKPINGVLYLRVTNLSGNTIVSTIGTTTSTDETIGVYQIDIFAPLGGGKNESVTMGDMIADHFKRGTQMLYNGVQVEAKNVRINPGRSAHGWYHIPIDIEYFSHNGAR